MGGGGGLNTMVTIVIGFSSHDPLKSLCEAALLCPK